MKNMRRLSALLLMTAILLFGFGALFQNCSAMRAMSGMTGDLPFEHPSIDESDANKTATQTQLLLGDRRFLGSVFRDVFLWPDSTQEERNFLDSVLMQELRAAQHLLGRGCDPMELGDNSPCDGILNNSQISLNAQTSSGREAARLQVCRRVISNDTMTARMIKNVSGNDITPNPTSIEVIVRLFYPNMDQTIVDEAVQRLTELDLGMTKGNERLNDRWKILLLTVCESSGWEAL